LDHFTTNNLMFLPPTEITSKLRPPSINISGQPKSGGQHSCFQSRRCSFVDSPIILQPISDVSGLSSILKRRLVTSGLVDKAVIDHTVLATSTLFDIERNKLESMGAIENVSLI
jgi:hypothetical protein